MNWDPANLNCLKVWGDHKQLTGLRLMKMLIETMWLRLRIPLKRLQKKLLKRQSKGNRSIRSLFGSSLLHALSLKLNRPKPLPPAQRPQKVRKQPLLKKRPALRRPLMKKMRSQLLHRSNSVVIEWISTTFS